MVCLVQAIDIHSVILAGGEGARLAPLSTADCPKPFIPLPDGTSLLQHTLRRLEGLCAPPPLLIAQARHRFSLMNHAYEAGVRPAAMLLEPRAANTGLAIAVAAAWMLRTQGGDAVLALLPSDHAIRDLPCWQGALREAAKQAAREDVLVMLAMEVPANPSLGYVQIARGRVTGFVEKPPNAAALVASGAWKAHAGQVVARACVLARAFGQHAPNLWARAQEAVAQAAADYEFMRLPDAPYAGLEPVPFDIAVLEKASNLAAIACDCGWEDLGTPATFTAFAGMDACPLPYPRTDRPWGYSETIAAQAQAVAKCLTLYPGRRLSLQRHGERMEVWLVMEGEAEVALDGTLHRLRPGDSLAIPQGAWHRLGNPGEAPLKVMEMQMGRPDESDIERAEDDYGRA